MIERAKPRPCSSYQTLVISEVLFVSHFLRSPQFAMTYTTKRATLNQNPSNTFFEKLTGISAKNEAAPSG